MPETGYDKGMEKRQERTGPSIDEAKMLRAQENTRALFLVLSRPWNSPLQLKWLIAQTFSSTTDLRSWLEKIDEYTSKKKPIPALPGQVYSDPYQDPDFIKDLTNECLRQFSELGKDFDATSRVAMRDYLVKSKAFAFQMLNPHYFLMWAGAGRLMLLVGEKDSGKSDWACTVADIAMQDEWVIFSNIELMFDDPKLTASYHYCRTFSEMLMLVCEAKLAGKKAMLIIDETGLEFASYDASTRSFKEIDRFHKITRKMGVAEIWITQYVTQCPWIILRTYSCFVEKLDKDLLRYEIRVGPYAGDDYLISRIPRTRLPFDTSHISSMRIDISMNDILELLESLPERANQFSAIMEFVRVMKSKMAEEIPNRYKKIVAMKFIRYMREHPGEKLTQKLISAILEVTDRSMRRWEEEMSKKNAKTTPVAGIETGEPEDEESDKPPALLDDEDEDPSA